MPKFTFTGDGARYYPSLGILAEPGAVHDLADLPDDGRWTGGAPEQPARPVQTPTPAADAASEKE